jgi:hypothetical protein
VGEAVSNVPVQPARFLSYRLNSPRFIRRGLSFNVSPRTKRAIKIGGRSTPDVERDGKRFAKSAEAYVAGRIRSSYSRSGTP